MLRLEEEDIYAGIATSGGGGGTPESAKGSFNASTQQLTLKYDYLVEKINSSDQLTAETKELIISRLNNSDVVVDMTRDIISIMGQSSDIAWCCSDGDPTSENPDELPTTMIFVSKSNPETSKLIIPADSGGVVFGSYNAMRAFYELQGQSLTAEEVEALLSSSVVDEEAFTISGTLGNFEVEFIEDGPVVEKYGATVSNLLGDVDSNGVLQAPTWNTDLVFTGVKKINDATALNFPKQVTSSGQSMIVATPTVRSVSFPDLEEVNGSGLQNAFNGTGIESISFPKLKYVRAGNGGNNYQAFGSAFAGGSYNYQGQYLGGLTSISFPELEEISGIYYAFNGTFNDNRNLTSISFPKLKKIDNCSYTCFSYCPLTSVEFPELQEVSMWRWFQRLTTLTSMSLPKLSKLSGYGLLEAFSGCIGLTSMIFPSLSNIPAFQGLKNTFQNCTSLASVSFPALTSTSFGNYTNQFNSMLSGVTGCTVHFPSNLQSVIGSWSDVTAGFGGTNTTVLFDLPATE